ncbi:MAG: hypothetical protein ABL962_14780 [Fimbriimonadaceae bacterium]
MPDEKLPLILHPGSGLATAGPQSERILSEMVTEALALSRSEETGAALPATVSVDAEVMGRRKLPPEKWDGFIRLAEKMLAEGINTPEKMARFLDTVFPSRKARPYSQALWQAIGVVNQDAFEAAGRVDWAMVYRDSDSHK